MAVRLGAHSTAQLRLGRFFFLTCKAKLHLLGGAVRCRKATGPPVLIDSAPQQHRSADIGAISIAFIRQPEAAKYLQLSNRQKHAFIA